MTDICKSDLAKELNCTTAAVNVWVRRGLPIDRHGRFDRDQALLWIIDNVEPQVAASGKVRGAARASQPMGDTKQRRRGGDRSRGNGHDALARLDPAQERAKRDKALTEKLVRENLIARGELVRIGDVVREYATACSIIRNKFLSLPAKLAPHLAAAATPEAARSLLYDEIVAILTEFSAGDARDRDEAA